MTLSNDKMRMLVNIPIDLKKEAEEIAKSENRSLSNYVVTLIQKDVEARKKK
ncbi:hypothetical protein AALA24_05985 [Anaerovoracaceae bacterium 42-11]